MAPPGTPLIYFVTTVVSHVSLLPTIRLLYSRGLLFEFAVCVFSFTASLSYHLCESLRIRLFLTALQWHQLDNVGVLTMIGLWDIFLCNFKNPKVLALAQYGTLLFTLIVQQPHPWDVRYSVFPVLLYGMYPLVHYGIFLGRPPSFHRQPLVLGLGFLSLAVPFFILGLDDPNDPYRIFHGLWHFFVGLASFFLWRVVKCPISSPAPKCHAPFYNFDTLV